MSGVDARVKLWLGSGWLGLRLAVWDTEASTDQRNAPASRGREM